MMAFHVVLVLSFFSSLIVRLNQFQAEAEALRRTADDETAKGRAVQAESDRIAKQIAAILEGG